MFPSVLVGLLCFLVFNSVIIVECKTLIFPGTKWCGIGNNSKNINDLGIARNVDLCCREHDMCPEYINCGETKYGLRNNKIVVRSSCECDYKFYNCLKQDNSFLANLFGEFFFNILNITCFGETCSNNKSNYWDDCPEFNKTNERVWYRNKRF